MIVLTPNQVVEILLLFLSGVFYLISVGVYHSRIGITNNDDRTVIGSSLFFGSMFLFFGLNVQFQWVIVK